MRLKVDLVSRILSKIVSEGNKVNLPGCHRVPAIQDIAPIYASPDRMINFLLLSCLVTVPLEVIVQSKDLTGNGLQIADPDMLA